MTAFVTFTSSTIVGWLALLSPFLLLAGVALAFTVPEVLRRRRVRRRMDGLFSPVRAASVSAGDAAGDGDFRLPVPCGSFAVGGGGPSAHTAAPHSVFAGGVPAPPVLGGPRRMVARSARAGGSDPELASRPGSFADRDGTSTPWHTFAALVTVSVLLVLLTVAMACQPIDDAGTDGRVDPTSEAETDSGSQP